MSSHLHYRPTGLDQLDRNDPFLGGGNSSDRRKSGGHQVISPRKFRPKMQAWMADPREIRAFLLHIFPKLHKDGKQRHQARIWNLCIFWCYRFRLHTGDAALLFNNSRLPGERKITAEYLRRVIQRMDEARDVYTRK